MDIHTVAIFSLIVGGIIGETFLALMWMDMENALAKQEETTAKQLEQIAEMEMNHVNR